MDDDDSSDASYSTPSPVPITRLRQHIESTSRIIETDSDYDISNADYSPPSPLCSPRGNESRVEVMSSSIDQEFEYIGDNSNFYSFGKLTGQEEKNRPKNRYANVIAGEETRVKLKQPREDDQSDYINANYIKAQDNHKFFIATQGPLKSTINDFWQMIWLENASVIIMLTRLLETGREKCEQYWPDEIHSQQQNGHITVTLVHEEQENHIICRTFEISHSMSEEKRKVWQLQYVEWPDHGLPSCSLTFRQLLRKADQYQDSSPHPLVVHCSAGIGRTGTFCVVHSVLRQLRQQSQESGQEKTINLPDIVLRLRNDRQGMVQTKDQYKFCYKAIIEDLEEFPEEYGIPPPNTPPST